MGKVKNILFIMADQLRWDYLSCYGHPHLKGLNIIFSLITFSIELALKLNKHIPRKGNKIFFINQKGL